MHLTSLINFVKKHFLQIIWFPNLKLIISLFMFFVIINYSNFYEKNVLITKVILNIGIYRLIVLQNRFFSLLQKLLHTINFCLCSNYIGYILIT